MFKKRQGIALEVHFTVNGNEYDMGYYLADGIYPEWAAFVKSYKVPRGEKHQLFAQHQESGRKDIECAFGVLQSRFAILRTQHVCGKQGLLVRSCMLAL